VCNRPFLTKDALKKHMNRKIPCVIVNPTIINRFKCDSCNRTFTTNQNLKKHIAKTCPIIKNKKTEVQIMRDEIIELKTMVNELKKNTATIGNTTIDNTTIGNTAITGNTTNSHNTAINSNNTQNITINITPFNNSKLEEKCIINTFLDNSTAASEYNKLEYMEKVNLENLHVKNLIKTLFLESIENSFSDDISNVNVYLSETREDTTKVYQGDHKWLPKSTMSVLRKEFDIFIEKCKEISGKINYPEGTPIGYKNSINSSVSMLSLMGNNKIIKDAKPEFNIILEANRDRLKNENVI
jgi:hypothetical protein